MHWHHSGQEARRVVGQKKAVALAVRNNRSLQKVLGLLSRLKEVGKGLSSVEHGAYDKS